nr:paraquat-inducible protein A [Undibacterium terreum]
MVSCHCCGTVWRNCSTHDQCRRCGSSLHVRKPGSLRRSWAFLITACIMYIPANLMPVMVTRTVLGTHEDTIMSGVIYFWISGSWTLASIIFIASVFVPLFKLGSLILLTTMAQSKSDWRRLERAKLYRLMETIGRWSMLDVFVISLLVGLVQIEGFASISAGFGAMAFGSVVVFTMLASHSFDPRLGWDRADQELSKIQRIEKAQNE